MIRGRANNGSPPSKLRQTRVFENAICSVSRLEVQRNDDLLAGRWVVPHVVITFAVALECPAGLFQLLPDYLAIAFHAAIFTRPVAVNSNGTSCSPLPSSKSSIAPGSLL
jgi:hypothetical protein